MNNLLKEMLDFDRVDESSILLVKKNGGRVLIKNATEKFIDKCYEILGKTILSSNKKEIKKDVIKWTEKELEYLKENVNLDLKILSQKLNKSYYQISHMKGKLKLIEKTAWSEEEIEYLKKNIDKSNFLLSISFL